MSKKPLNLIDVVAGYQGGKPVDVEIGDVVVQVRRDFTGVEVAEYVSLFAPEYTDSHTVEQQLRAQLSILCVADDDALNKAIEVLCKLPFVVVSEAVLHLGVMAGLRDAESGSFLLKSNRSTPSVKK